MDKHMNNENKMKVILCAIYPQGGSDPVVPKQHSILLKDKIRAVCGEARVDLRLYGERTHSDAAFMTEKTCVEIVRFFDRYLK